MFYSICQSRFRRQESGAAFHPCQRLVNDQLDKFIRVHPALRGLGEQVVESFKLARLLHG